jgi:hypothetical protein
MTSVRHQYSLRSHGTGRANPATLWLLVVVVVTVFLALTFGDAVGMGAL